MYKEMCKIYLQPFLPRCKWLQIHEHFCAMFWMKVGSDAFTKSFARLKECFDEKSLRLFSKKNTIIHI